MTISRSMFSRNVRGWDQIAHVEGIRGRSSSNMRYQIGLETFGGGNWTRDNCPIV